MSEPQLIDADELRQRIFDAGRAIGRGDPFLASELADSVMHFLHREFDEPITWDQSVHEACVKFVRELGHPKLAVALRQQAMHASESICEQAYAESPIHQPPTRQEVGEYVAPTLREFSRSYVYSSNLLAAHDLGLIEIGDLDMPFELAGGVIDPASQGDASEANLIAAITEARDRFGRFVELDLNDAIYTREPAPWCRALASALRLGGLEASVHITVPPRMVKQGHSLFPWAESAARSHQLRTAWIRQLILNGRGYVRPVIHVTGADLADGSVRETVRVIVESRADSVIAFVRDHGDIWSATGRDSNCTSVLTNIRVNLLALLHSLTPRPDVDSFIERLGGLTRLAHAAGRAKLAYLKRAGRASLRHAFILDRSAVLITSVAEFAVARDLEATESPAKLVASMRKSMESAAKECTKQGPTCVISPQPVDATLDVSVSKPHLATDEVLNVTIGDITTNVENELAALLARLYRETTLRAVKPQFSPAN